MENIIILGYLSDKTDDGEELYTGVKVFKLYADYKNYMSKNHDMTDEEINELFNSQEPIDDMVVWIQPFNK